MTHMPRIRATILWLVAVVVPSQLTGAEEAPTKPPPPPDYEKTTSPLQLSLWTLKTTYLLGEPILLAGSLHNPTGSPIQEYDVHSSEELHRVGISFSRNGVEWQSYRMGLYSLPKVRWRLKTLGAGDRWVFTKRVLYSDESPSRLALGKPGKYFARISYPLKRARTLVRSAPVEFTIQAPEAEDLALWKVIQKPQAIRFLQTGEASEEADRLPFQLATLLKEHPGTGYAAAVRYALGIHYLTENLTETAKDEDNPNVPK